MGRVSKKDKVFCYKRDEGHCRGPDGCGKAVAYEASHCDHINPEWMGGASEPSNYQTLCHPCHAVKTRRDAKKRAKAKRIARKQAGAWKRKGRLLQGRGFDKTKSRRFDGSVVERKRT